MINLSITDLHKSYGSSPILRGLDLEVPTGSFTSILGPSGSGKTTLLRVIAGFERADSGEVRFDDEVVDDGTHYVTPDQRRIGYVPQDGSLFPHLSVQQNIGFGLSRRDRDPKKIAELMELVGLAGLNRRYPHQLSGGQQQRVALARALAIEPALVLLDEPFSSLDASLRASVRQDVRHVLQVAGATVVLVTHDQDEALSLSDHVAVISGGQIGQCDTPVNIYTHPLNPSLALGFGETNFLQGTRHDDSVETPLGRLSIEMGLTPGNPTTSNATSLLVLVRPEQLVISQEVQEASATAMVVDAEFYGHDAVVHLRGDWAGSPNLVARIADAQHIPTKGSRVALSVRGNVATWDDVTALNLSSVGTSAP
jgi:iron(III) transport system ATP-binding protein